MWKNEERRNSDENRPAVFIRERKTNGEEEERKTRDERRKSGSDATTESNTPRYTTTHVFIWEGEREERWYHPRWYHRTKIPGEWSPEWMNGKDETRRKKKRRQRKETEPSSPVTIDPSAEDGCPHPLFNKKTSGKVHIDNTQRKREKWRIEEEQFKESLWRKPTS